MRKFSSLKILMTLTVLFASSILFNQNLKAQTNYAISFNGSNQYVDLGTNAALKPTTAFTLEAWVKINTTSGQLDIISSGPDGTSMLGYHFVIENGKVGLWCNSYNTWCFSNTTLQTGVWYHVAVTYSTTNGAKVYVNGSLENSDNSPTNNITYDGTSVKIGVLAGNTGYYHFNGTMDEIRVWNVEKSAADIAANKDYNINPSSSGLVAYYKMNEGTGSTANDATSNGLNGTIINGASWVVSGVSLSSQCPSITAAMYGTTSLCSGYTTILNTYITGGTSPYTLVYSGGTINNYTSGANIFVSPSTTTTYTLISVTDANGCSATVSGSPTVTIKSTSSSNTTISACDSFWWNGIKRTTSGIYTWNGTNAAGCDSTATLNLTINNSSTSSTTIASCDSLIWNGTKYTTSGTYTYSTTNAAGCDSTATLNLTINNSSTSSTTTSACDSLVWNGATYIVSGTYTWTGTNAAGCDSVATLILTVNNSNTSTTTTSACDSLVWNGATYTASGTYTWTGTNAAGCDSVATLNLTVLSASSSNTSATICANQAPYVWNGNNYSSTGSYTVHYTNSIGCDSSAILNLIVNANPNVAPIVGLTNIEILAVGGGGGAGGPDGALGAGGGAGGVVYGSYTLSTTGSSIYTVGVGGAGGFGQGCAGNAAGGTAGVNGGATGGNAGVGGCSGGGGGSGGWSGLFQGSNYIVVAGGGAGGGGSNEGTAKSVTTPGGGNQNLSNGTSMTGENGTAFSGDGGGGGAGGGGFYGGAGQSNLTSTGTNASQAWGGANYTNPTGRNSFATYIGTSGQNTSTGTGGLGTTTTISNASNFNYINTYGKGGNAQGNGGTSTTANGNNGVVIIRYAGSPVATGGTVTQSGGYTLHTFTTPGSNTFTANSGNSVCAGSTTTLNCATIGGVWSSSDTNIATIHPSTGLVTGKVAGTVTITYTVTSPEGCVGSSTKQFTVNPLPIVPAITGNTTICDNTTTTLSNTLTGGVWSSSLTSKATINATTGLVTGISSGTSTITYLYTDNNGCSSTNSTVVTINASPIVAAITGNAGVCIGSTTTFANATSGGSWSSSNTGVATINNSGLISTVAAGASTISYTVVNASACTTVVTKPITVNALPNVTANSTASTVCFGTQITLTGGNANSYTWNNGVTNGVAFAPSSTTTYTVTGTDGNGCVKSANITITVNALPIVSISPSASTLCNGYSSILTSSGANTYGWTILGSTPFLDQVSSTSTLKLAAGLHKLRSSYSGSAIRIRRSSDNAEQDFGFNGNDLDVASISTFIGAGTAYVKTLYDQSGNGNHLSQTSTGNQPTLILSGLNGKPVIRTNTSQNIFTSTNFPAPFSIVYAARQTGGSRGRLLAGINNNWLLGWWGGNKAQAFYEGWVSNGGGNTSDNNVYVYSGTATGANSSFAYQNKISITANPSGGNQGPNGLSFNRSEPSDAEFTDVVAFNSVLSTTDRNIVENGMGAYYGLSGFYNTTGASTTVTPSTTSNYTVYGTDGNGCIGTATQVITVNPKPNAGADVNYLCGGATQTLTGTANTGTWTALSTNPSGATLSATSSGVATVSFANLASGIFSFIYTLPTTNCSDTMSITVRPKPNAGADQAVCILNVATGVTLTSNVTGVWSANSGNAGTSNIVSASSASTQVNNFSVVGDYNYINTNNGCTDTVKVTVTPSGSIGNYVWKDQNNDGIQNEPASNGVNGITVELYKKDGNGAFNLYNSVQTSNDGNGNPGYYNFGICEYGIYKIKVPTVNPFTQTRLTTQDATPSTDYNSDVDASTGFSNEITINTYGNGVAKDNNTIDVGYQICTKPIAGNDRVACGADIVSITGISTTPALPSTDGNWSAMINNPSGANLSATNLGVATINFDSLADGTYNFIYTVTGSCDDTMSIVVTPKPNAGSDVPSICGGHSQTIVGLPNTGTWSALSSNQIGANLGSTSSGIATVQFDSLAIGVYTFIYTSIAGCTDTMTITAYPKPSSGVDLTVCGTHSQTISGLPNTGTWSALSSNPSGATFSGSNNSIETITFDSLASGVYTFIYTVPSGCIDTMTITAYPKPSAGSDTGLICGGTIMPLIGYPAGGTWSQLSTNPNGGATVGSTNVNGQAELRFAHAISGGYTFIYTMPSGCSDTMVITTKPRANAGGNIYMECGTPRLFDTLRASPNNGIWTGFASNNNLVTLYTNDTLGRVRLDLPPAPNQGSWSFVYTPPNSCHDTMTYTIGVTGTPAPAVNQGINPICGTNTVQLCPTVWGWSNYQWYRNGVPVTGIRGTSACITVDTSNLGSYRVAGTNGSACWSKQSPAVVISLSGPVTPTITSQSGSFTACNGGSITLISSSSIGNQWSRNGTPISGATSQYFSPTSNGVYTVTVTNCGYITTSAGATVTLVPYIYINQIQSPSNTGCTGSNLQLTNATTGGVWSSSNPLVASINSSTGLVNCVAVGSVTITYTVTINGCSNFVTYNLNVANGSSVPTPSIAAQSSTTICGNATVTICPSTFGWTNYQWYKNGLPITANGTGACFTADTANLGSYTLTASVGNCWSALSNAIVVNGTSLPTTPTISAGGAITVCNGGSVTLTSSSSLGNQWRKDGINISGATSKTYIANTSGVYTVVNSNCAGSVTSNPISITVVPYITLNSINTGTGSICKNTSTTLTNSTSGGVWTSSNNLVATINSSTGFVTGVDTGSVIITYTVTVSGCSNYTTATLRIVDGSSITTPTIAVQGSTAICNGSTVQICPVSYGYSNYQWYRNGNAVSVGGNSACLSATTVGSYTLSATNGNGCWSALSNAIVITNTALPATPTISASGSTTICSGSSVALTSSASTGNQWFLNGNIISGATSQTFNATTAGVYTVTASNCGGTTSSVGITVTVNSGVSVAPITTTTNSSTLCFGSTIALSCATAGGTWTSSNTSVATINPTTGVASPITNGSTTITYTVTSGGCTGTSSYLLNVQLSSNVLTPTLDIRGSTTLCGNASVQICPLVWGYSNYQWYKNGVPFSTSSCVTLTDAGSYTLTGTNGSGCWSAQSLPAVVTNNPLPIVDATSGPNALCSGSSITLSNSTTIPMGGSAAWSSQNVRASVNSSTGLVTGNTSGQGVIRYQVTSAVGCSSFVDYNVTVNSTPATPNISFVSGQNPFSGAPSGSWCRNRIFTLGGFPTGGVFSSTLISVNPTSGLVNTGSTTGPASLSYTITNSALCSATRTFTFNVAACTPKGSNITKSEKVIDFNVYPNPAKDIINIKIDNAVSGTIILTDLYGKQLIQQPIVLGNNSINISKYAKGLYLVTIATETNKVTKKFVIE